MPIMTTGASEKSHWIRPETFAPAATVNYIFLLVPDEAFVPLSKYAILRNGFTARAVKSG
jgi:hypothetical protein